MESFFRKALGKSFCIFSSLSSVWFEMDSSVAGLDRIEAQSSFPMNFINNSLRSLSSQDSLQTKEEGTTPVAEFFTNLRLSDYFDLPSEYVPMNPEIFSAVSADNKNCLEKLRSYGKTPMACFKSDGGDYVLHLAAASGHLEVVKNIVSECPCLLLEPNWNDQLPIHVAASAGHLAVVEALVAAITFVSRTLTKEEEKGNLNLYHVKDIYGDTPLHLALKGCHMKTASCLVKAEQRASFLANKAGQRDSKTLSRLKTVAQQTWTKHSSHCIM